MTFTPEFRTEAFGSVKDLVLEGLALSVADLDEVSPWIEAGDIFAWGGVACAMPVSLAVLRSRREESLIDAVRGLVLESHREHTRRRARPVTPAGGMPGLEAGDGQDEKPQGAEAVRGNDR